MVKRIRKYVLGLVCIGVLFNISGCTIVEKIEKKLGWKNEYFEYLQPNNVYEISIQSTRDPGFKFIVTEDSAIKEMYNLLSKSQISEQKSELEPDYKFEFDLVDEVKEFYYVVGSDEGNFYNGENIYTVSKRLDEGIIKNLSFIRKPREFETIYYNSILETLKLAQKSLIDTIKEKGLEESIDDYKIGVNVKGDVDCLKYIFSADLIKFEQNAKEIFPNLQLIDNNEGEFDVVINVKNRGYDSTNFKTLITINNKKDNTEEKYYVIAVNEFKEWSIDITGPNPEKRPDKW